MKHAKIYLTMLLLFLVSMPLISSEILFSGNTDINTPSNFEVIYIDSNENFGVALGTSDVQVCKCGIASSYLTITNTGNFASMYKVIADEDYITFSEQDVVLQASESKKVLIYYKASCTAMFSTNNIELKVVALNGDHVDIDQTVHFNNCQNLAIELENEDIIMNPCETEVFNLTIQNTGGFTETYDISVNSEVEDHTTLGYKSVSLPSMDFIEVPITFNPSCEVYGDYVMDVTVKARKNAKIATLSKNITIERNYIFDTLTVPEEFVVCAGENLYAEMQIENHNNFANEFVFDIDAPSFVDFKFPVDEEKGEAKSIILSAESKTSIPIELTTTQKQVGEYEVIITTKSDKGNLVKEYVVPVTVQNCYDFDIEIPTNKLYVCGLDTFSQEVIIHNKGIKNTTVKFKYDGPVFGSLESYSKDIIANNVENKMNVNFISAIDSKTRYPVTVDMYHKGNLVGTDSFDVQVYDTDYCYKAAPMKVDISLVPAVTEFNITLKNQGIRYNTYSVEVINAPDFLNLENEIISLGSKDKGDLHFTIDEDDLDNYANEYNNGSLIGIVAQPMIVVTHIDSDVSFAYVLNFETTDYPLYQRVWSYLYFLPTCTLIFSILTILTFVSLIFFIAKIITKEIKDLKFKPKKWLLITSVVILVVASIFIFSTQEFPVNMPLSGDSQLELNMYEGSNKTLDMTEYFTDEDEDIISYNLEFEEYSSEIDYLFENESLTLLPEENWSGNTSFTLTATDSYFETATSESIFLKVFPLKKYDTCGSLYSAWCPFMNLVLLCLALLFLFLGIAYRPLTKEELKAIERAKKKEERRIEREKKALLKQKEKEKLARKKEREKKAKLRAKKAKK